MNCCDEYGDCRQGRDCPARVAKVGRRIGIGYDASGCPCTCAAPAKVAKVKNRHHGKAALPQTVWRSYMRHLAKWMLIVLAMLALAAVTVSLTRGLA